MYNPYDPFLANSLAQVQAAGGLAGAGGLASVAAAAAADPRLQNLAAAGALGTMRGFGHHPGHPPITMASGLPAGTGIAANISLQAAMANQAAAIYTAANGGAGLPAAA